MPNPKITEDPRIDPRIKALFGEMALPAQEGDVESCEQMIAAENSEEAIAALAELSASTEMRDSKSVAPSAGLSVTIHEFVSGPDGNMIKIRFIRPDNDHTLPCVY